MAFLYIIKNEGKTKIGITANVERRMKELRPDKVCEVVELSEGREKELEKELHRRFRDKRLQGSEYFSLNWAERAKACHLARQAGKKSVLLIMQRTMVGRTGWVLEICGVCLAIGVAAVLITRPQPNMQPQKVPTSLTAPGKVWFSYERQPQLV